MKDKASQISFFGDMLYSLLSPRFSRNRPFLRGGTVSPEFRFTPLSEEESMLVRRFDYLQKRPLDLVLCSLLVGGIIAVLLTVAPFGNHKVAVWWLATMPMPLITQLVMMVVVFLLGTLLAWVVWFQHKSAEAQFSLRHLLNDPRLKDIARKGCERREVAKAMESFPTLTVALIEQELSKPLKNDWVTIYPDEQPHTP